MQVPVYSVTGEEVKQIEISESVFGVPFNQGVVHQVMVGQRANARQGTVSTRTRGEVTGSTRKLYRQKGTGNARAGSIKSPLRRGGGIVFGPKPRSYRQALPKRMRRLALRCVLSAKVRDQELKIVEALEFEQPKTREMAQVLAALGVTSSSLIVTGAPEENVIKSARNLPGVKTMPASLLNVVDILSRKMLLITVSAVRRVEELWGEESTGGESSATASDIAPSADN
ncbi:MAG: 50S ribosomal protein L4 [Dehalococcoidales bacterium]|nr:50S ribosomal protein L4 [Dehalococcoidales bacterium]MDZ4230884.1 50S ribosomal protein L4 [Dehalococcoidales bacterium]